MGKMLLKRKGEDREDEKVYMGRNIEKKKKGGKLEGVMGVMGGMEVMRKIKEMNIRKKRKIVVVKWKNEEGKRFEKEMME